MADRSDVVELRIAVPREQLPSAPAVDFYSQENCHLLGLRARQFLELLRRSDAPPATKVGKLRLVRRDRMVDFLERLREREPKPVGELDGADRVLMELGCAPQKRKAG